jgi:hypothetical protein
MDQAPQDTTSACPVCGGSRWWRSRMGWRICQQCYRDPLQALEVLADRVQGACDSAINDQKEQTCRR